MRIAIEASVLARPAHTGVAIYTQQLLRATWPHLATHEIVLCSLGRTPPPIDGLRARRIGLPWIPPRLFRACMAAHCPLPPFDRLLGLDADVFFFPDFVAWPLRRDARAIAVVYDLSFLRVPQWVSRGNRLYLRRGVQRSLQRATHVLTISNSVRAEILARSDRSPHTTSVITPGVDRAVFRPLGAESASEVQKKYGIDRPFILFLGTLEPRKNITGLIAAYGELPATLQRDYALVLAGGRGWLDAGIHAHVARARAAGAHIVTPGSIASPDVPGLLNAAKVFAYPSHYEGFGMPVLEAMACGVPVVTSDDPALVELTGPAALHADPRSPEKIAAALTEVLTRPERAAELARAGLARAADFEWNSRGRDLADLLLRLAAMPRS